MYMKLGRAALAANERHMSRVLSGSHRKLADGLFVALGSNTVRMG